MKLRWWSLLCILYVSSLSIGQTTAPKPTPSHSKALAACEKKLANSGQTNDALYDSWKAALEERDRLRTENDELKKKDAELRAAALDVLGYTSRLDAEYRRMLTDYNHLIDHYNSALREANSAIQEANSRLAYQQRVNNALAIYQLMPRYQPPQTFNINVTDCSKYPALCIH